MINYRNEKDLVAYHHDRGSDRVSARKQEVDHQPARDRHRYEVIFARAEERDARSARRDPDRRDSRPGNHAGGDRPGRYRSPGYRDTALEQCTETLDRIINMFPQETASAGATWICRSICARSSRSGSFAASAVSAAAVEIMLNTPRIAELIQQRRHRQGQGVLLREHRAGHADLRSVVCSSCTRKARSRWTKRWRTRTPAPTSKPRFTSADSPARTGATPVPGIYSGDVHQFLVSGLSQRRADS